MSALVVLLGVLITVLGVAGLAAPRSIVGRVLGWPAQTRFHVAVGVRLGFGAALFLAASSSRFPGLIYALGVIALVSAGLAALLGQRRVDSLFEWWFQRPMAVLRAWFAVAIPFGGFLVYAGL